MVTGNDVDCGPQLSYALVLDNGASGTFSILHYGGRVMLRGPLDYEQHSRYSLTVRASDSQHETEANITVLVEDVNDNPPVFAQALYQVPGPFPPYKPTHLLATHSAACSHQAARLPWGLSQAPESPVPCVVLVAPRKQTRNGASGSSQRPCQGGCSDLLGRQSCRIHPTPPQHSAGLRARPMDKD